MGSPTIITPIMGKGMSKVAFQGQLECPYCNHTKWKYVENQGKFRIRYRCKNCHKTLIYDFTNNPGHPYCDFGKGIFRRIVERDGE